MTKQNVQSIVIMNGNASMGPQIVLPFFRPISIYEIEDDYDDLIKEIKTKTESELKDEMISFLDAFKESLEAKTADPLFNYFVFNHAGNIDMNQIQDVFDALDNFIEVATDEDRPMH